MTLLEQFWLSGLAVCFFVSMFVSFVSLSMSISLLHSPGVLSLYMFQLYVPEEMAYSPPCLPCDGDCSSEPFRAAPAASAAA